MVHEVDHSASAFVSTEENSTGSKLVLFNDVLDASAYVCACICMSDGMQRICGIGNGFQQ